MYYTYANLFILYVSSIYHRSILYPFYPPIYNQKYSQINIYSPNIYSPDIYSPNILIITKQLNAKILFIDISWGINAEFQENQRKERSSQIEIIRFELFTTQ